METVGMSEARARLAELAARVQHTGERILIERHGKPAAALISIADLRRIEAEDDLCARERRLASLGRAKAVSDEILARRGGVPLPDSVDMLREMREQRDYDISGGTDEACP